MFNSKKLLAIVFSLFMVSTAFAQNLKKERIWKISSKKRSIFFDKGIFHSPLNAKKQSLSGLRNSYVKSRGYERIVFDFSSSTPPRVYGHISKKESKIYLDFFNTSLSKNVKNLQNIKYIKSVDFFNLDENTVSVEVYFQKGSSFDIFYLEDPARLVIDVKK